MHATESAWRQSGPLEPVARFACVNSGQRFNRGFDRETLLNADGKPPGGLACGSFGLSRGSSWNHLNRKPPVCLEVLWRAV